MNSQKKLFYNETYLSETPAGLDFEIDKNFQTPPAIARYMIDLIPAGCKSILEPTPGEGNIVSELIKTGRFDVFAPKDFFLLDEKLKFDCIVMNPPFSLKTTHVENAPMDINLNGLRSGYFILDKCLKLSKNVIAIMPMFLLTDSDRRSIKYKKHGLISITLLPRKTFDYARITTAIFNFKKGFNGETVFRLYQKTN